MRFNACVTTGFVVVAAKTEQNANNAWKLAECRYFAYVCLS
jgi:hypothetical protein